MSEIKCPHCQRAFTVDESGYIAILAQVRDAEFSKELSSREQIFQSEKQQALKLAQSEASANLQQCLAASQQEIAQLKSTIQSTLADKQLAIKEEESKKQQELAEKEKLITKLQSQLEQSEQTLKAEASANLQQSLAASQQEIAQLKSTIQTALADKQLAIKEEESKKQQELAEKEKLITKLQSQLEQSEQTLKAEAAVKLQQSLAINQQEIEKLKSTIQATLADKQLAIKEEEAKRQLDLAEKEKRIYQLTTDVEQLKLNAQLEIKAKEETYQLQLREKDATIEYFKDLKARLSTKMLGESLEQHCEIEFNRQRSLGFQNAYFEKDNDARSGSKGDYIFRESDEEGLEFISIMFEMKNESDTTATKKRNEDFFKELDKDRREKGCEYAVLVSLLESDNELYNAGIVDVSHRYPKMYVVRPQFFIPIITLLRNAALGSLQYRKELAIHKSQNIDVTNFESKLENFKTVFDKHCLKAGEKFETAIKAIDNTIKQLEKTRAALLGSNESLRKANDKLVDLTIKKLTWNNPTMKKLLKDQKTDEEE